MLSIYTHATRDFIASQARSALPDARPSFPPASPPPRPELAACSPAPCWHWPTACRRNR
jgi:hypothetical protein